MITNAEYKLTDEPIGLVKIGTTTFTVHRLVVGPGAASAGVCNHFVLTGPRGSQFYVIDHGPHYELTSACSSRGSAPRRLPGLDRKHLAPFGVKMNARYAVMCDDCKRG